MSTLSKETAKRMGMIPELNPLFNEIPDEMVLSVEQISNLLNRSQETVRRWAREGRLRSYSWGGKYVILGNDFKDFLQFGGQQRVKVL